MNVNGGQAILLRREPLIKDVDPSIKSQSNFIIITVVIVHVSDLPLEARHRSPFVLESSGGRVGRRAQRSHPIIVGHFEFENFKKPEILRTPK